MPYAMPQLLFTLCRYFTLFSFIIRRQFFEIAAIAATPPTYAIFSFAALFSLTLMIAFITLFRARPLITLMPTIIRVFSFYDVSII